MNSQDKKLLELYLQERRKKRIILCLIILVIIALSSISYMFYLMNTYTENGQTDSIINEIDIDVTNTKVNEEKETNIPIFNTEKENNEVTKNEIIPLPEQTSNSKEIETTEPKNNLQEEIEIETNAKIPINKDFLFTEGYTLENVSQVAQDYLNSFGVSGECIPLQDEDGVYLGIRVVFY